MCSDLFYSRTMQIMLNAHNKKLAGGVQRFFIVSQGECELRDGCKFVLPKAKKEVKKRRILFNWVQLWNSAQTEAMCLYSKNHNVQLYFGVMSVIEKSLCVCMLVSFFLSFHLILTLRSLG